MKTIIYVILLSMASVIFTGCGNHSESRDIPSKPSSSGSQTKPVELVFYYNSGASEQVFDANWGDKIRNKFPTYTIKFIPKQSGSTLPQLVAAGTTVDIVIDSIGQIGGTGSIIDSGMEYDMTDLVKKHSVDLSRIEPTSLDSIKNLGGLYGIPVHTNSLILYYNKDIFDKFGMAYPKDGMTWDDLQALSKKTTREQDGQNYAGFAISPGHYLRMNQQSLSLVNNKNGKAELNNDKFKQLFQTVFMRPGETAEYQNYFNKIGNKIPGPDQFSKDKTAAMLLYFIGTTTTDNFQGINWDMVSVPTFKELPGIGPQSYPSYFSITRNNPFKDESMEVIKYIISDEFQLELSKQGAEVPILNDDRIKKAFSQNKNQGKNYQAIFATKYAPANIKTKFDSLSEKELNNALLSVVRGSMDVNTALKAAEESANKAIESAK